MGVFGRLRPLPNGALRDTEHRLRPTLSWPHLIALGVGAIVGTGIYAFVILALPAFDDANLHPFMPYGFGSHFDGTMTRGVMAAAAIVFFAFYGFDAVATSAEETRNPSRDLTIGIIGSMVLCTTIYILVAAVGAVPIRCSAVHRSRSPWCSGCCRIRWRPI